MKIFPRQRIYSIRCTENEVGPNQIGELVVRGANVMQGYWNAPDETAKRFRPGHYRADAVLYSGDLFRRDNDGFL